MNGLREIDEWLMKHVLPYRRDFNALARRLVGPDDAEDLVQDALARMIAAPNWREIQNPRAFTLTIIRNLAFEHKRKVARLPLAAGQHEAAFDVPDDQPGPFVLIDSRRNHEQLLALLKTLPPQCRRAVELRKFDGRSPGEIAEIMQIAVSTVEKHLVKGLARLVEGLRRDGIGIEEDSLKDPWKKPNQRGR